MAVIFTSLKVVSIAVLFLTSTKRLAIVLRRRLIFSRVSVRVPGAGGALCDTAGGGGVGVDTSVLARDLGAVFCCAI